MFTVDTTTADARRVTKDLTPPGKIQVHFLNNTAWQESGIGFPSVSPIDCSFERPSLSHDRPLQSSIRDTKSVLVHPLLVPEGPVLRHCSVEQAFSNLTMDLRAPDTTSETDDMLQAEKLSGLLGAKHKSEKLGHSSRSQDRGPVEPNQKRRRCHRRNSFVIHSGGVFHKSSAHGLIPAAEKKTIEQDLLSQPLPKAASKQQSLCNPAA